MTSTSLNIAGKVDPRTVEVVQLVERLSSALNIPYVVIGATARDLVLHHYYGARIQRATQDIDFAIQVADWSAFSALTDALEKEGFEAHRHNNAKGWLCFNHSSRSTTTLSPITPRPPLGRFFGL